MFLFLMLSSVACIIVPDITSIPTVIRVGFKMHINSVPLKLIVFNKTFPTILALKLVLVICCVNSFYKILNTEVILKSS